MSARTRTLLARLAPAARLVQAGGSLRRTPLAPTPTTMVVTSFVGGCQWGAARSFAAADEALSAEQQARAARKAQRFEELKELDAPALYTMLLQQFETSGPPGNNALCLYLDKCTTAEDAAQAVELTRRFRADRVYNSQLQPLPEEVAAKLVGACVRGGRVDAALGMLARATEQGLVLTDAVFAQLAADNSKLEEAQVDAVVDAYNELEAVRGSASSECTAAVLLTLLKGGEVERSVEFCEMLVEAGQKPMGAVWELIANASKEAGLAERASAVAANMGSA